MTTRGRPSDAETTAVPVAAACATTLRAFAVYSASENVRVESDATLFLGSIALFKKYHPLIDATRLLPAPEVVEHDRSLARGERDAMTSSETHWYERLRRKHRPKNVRVLLIGESAPDHGSKERRFFYAPTLDRRDNLFRGVVAAFYGSKPGVAGDAKGPWLERLVASGVYLIDLVPYPVDKLDAKSRARARRDHVDACVQAARLLAPAGIIVCHQPSFHVLAPALLAAKLPLLHTSAIPFPLGNHRERFVISVKAALGRMNATT